MAVACAAAQSSQTLLLSCMACLVIAVDPELSMLETRDLRLLYFDPQQTYLVPHVARSFHNSLEFQRDIFDWTPWNDKTVVLLKDFADYGNAAATASPVNLLLLDVAPPNHAFETLPGSDRFYSAMNHELVHVVQGDVWIPPMPSGGKRSTAKSLCPVHTPKQFFTTT